MRNWDSGTGTGTTRTAGLGHAELGQREWDMRYKDSGTGPCGTGTAGLGQALQGHFCFFCDTNVEKNFFLRWYVIIVVTNTVESLR